jgi:DNA-binding PadR family transcriptional regulator
MTRRLDRGLYAITETGIAYLDEELDADQLTTNEDIEE